MITYIIKVILCSAIFLLTYKVLLEKERMHRFNRFYLLAGLLLSFIIPAITFSSSTALPVYGNEILDIPVLQDNVQIQTSSPDDNTNYTFSILLSLYVTITALLFVRFIRNLKKLLFKTWNNTIIPYKESKIVLINEDLTPHSFLNYLFINNEEYKKGNIENEILVHEYAHVQQKHSYDILLMEILQIFFWFNPFIFLYIRAIRLNHEFLADEIVIDTYQNIVRYQYLLIDKANKNTTSDLTCQFNYSITKKRLIMMTKSKSLISALCRQIALIPVVALSIFVFSTRSLAQDIPSVQKPKQKVVVPSTQEGISGELQDEYDRIINKTKDEKGFLNKSKLSEEDKSRLEKIYLSMSKDQQAKQKVGFTPAPPPLPRVVPTEAQIESWKNSKIYGVWIDNKRVSNSELNKYQNTDFAQAFVSKLAKIAINYGKHYYQVNLMTKQEYDSYYNKTMERKERYHMVYQRVK